MSIQRYDIKRLGGIDLDDALVPYEFGQVVKTADYERELAAKEEEIERLERESRCPCCKDGVNMEGEPCQECHGKGIVSLAYDTCRIQNNALKAQVERLSAPVILFDDELLALNEKYGYFQFGDAQGTKSRAFADDISRIIASRAAKEQTK